MKITTGYDPSPGRHLSAAELRRWRRRVVVAYALRLRPPAEVARLLRLPLRYVRSVAAAGPDGAIPQKVGRPHKKLSTREKLLTPCTPLDCTKVWARDLPSRAVP